MIERVLLDRDGNELLNLWRWNREQSLYVKAETLPDLVPIGTVEEVPGTGQKIFIGERRPKAGQITLTIGTHGKNHEHAFALQREIAGLAPRIGAYSQVPGGTLGIAGYSSLKRTFQGSAQFGGTVELTLECTDPYFWGPGGTQALAAGANTVTVSGAAPTGVLLELTAAQSVTNPQIMTDAGMTVWEGVLQAGQTLVLDSRTGWDVRLGGVDVSLTVDGPLPLLEPGERTVTLSSGLTGQITWQEGEL